MQFEDLIYEVRNGVAWITINRPEKMNSFRGKTCDELIKALYKAGYDKDVGAIVLAGAGEEKPTAEALTSIALRSAGARSRPRRIGISIVRM